MVKIISQGLLPALFTLLFVSTASPASFTLPDDAIINVDLFPFPATQTTTAHQENGIELSAELQQQIISALQKAGFTIAEAEDISPNALPPAIAALEPSQTSPIANLGKEPDATDKADEENMDAPLADGKVENNDAGKPMEPQAAQKAAQYRLVGRVTLYNERTGTPARVGRGVRVNVEVSLRCTFRAVDMATGKAIIAQAASGSGISSSQSGDVDAILPRLQEQAFAATAYDIASRLSGKNLNKSSGYIDENYRDSPGKRLRP